MYLIIICNQKHLGQHIYALFLALKQKHTLQRPVFMWNEQAVRVRHMYFVMGYIEIQAAG